MSTLFFDLDGTILDIKAHHIHTFRIVSEKLSLPYLSDNEYWERKSNGKFPWDSLEKTDVDRYLQEFIALVETPTMLLLDTVVPHMPSLLKHYTNSYSLVLITNRRNKNALINQLKTLQLFPLFSAILPSFPQGKFATIAKYGYNPDDIIIGDTEEDIQTAQSLNISSLAVTWGIRDRRYLSSLKPTYIIESPQELKVLL